jgi:hypothetical protein
MVCVNKRSCVGVDDARLSERILLRLRPERHPRPGYSFIFSDEEVRGRISRSIETASAL